MSNNDSFKRAKPWLGWALFAAVTVIVFLLVVLAASIMERRQEARIGLAEGLVPIDEFEVDPAAWAVNYPRQYDRYQRTARTDAETKYGGPAFRDYLEEVPANVILFAGMAFAKDYNQARGHAYSRQDTLETGRLSPEAPATCWTCKSGDVPRLMAEFGMKKTGGDGNFHQMVMSGAEDFYKANFHDMAEHVEHPIACIDCHDPENMQLRITRPALIEAMQARGQDPQALTHQEMRSAVCAQCHVEYYFGEDNYLILPWKHGVGIEDMERHFDQIGFADWVHAISGTEMIKMQHPDYEVYSHGIHAYRDVACADCHMPYRSEGGIKFTDHHIQSPLLNVENSCAVCHRWGEQEIINRVESIQDSVFQSRALVERSLARAHFDVAACMQAGAEDAELVEVRQLIRAAQMRWDYVAANKGMGFHAPQECLRILASAAELAGRARVKAGQVLARHGYTEAVNYPEYDSKEKAQQLVEQFVAGEAPDLLF